MEVQADAVEPPKALHADPQPAGRINKAAFKLFGKRSTGSDMASFFSFRNKGATNAGNNGSSDNGSSLNGNGSVASVELVRSKTHDGLMGSNAEPEARPGEGHHNMEAVPVRSLSKSFSFFSFLRRGSFRASDNGGAGFVRRGRGLKGFFSSMRWRRKEKTSVLDVEEKDGAKEKSEEICECEKDITLTLEPPPHHHAQEDCGNKTEEPDLCAQVPLTTSVSMTPQHCVAMPGPSVVPDSAFSFTPTDSPLHPAVPKTKASISSLSPSLATPPLDRCSAGDPPSEPSVDRLCSLLFTDVTSLKSFDSLTGCGDIIADAEEEGPAGNGGSGTSSSSSGGGGGSSSASASAVRTPSVPCSAVTRMSPSKPPLHPQVTQVYSAISIPAVLPSHVRPPPDSPPQNQNGSGIVAYMGGGEEMASPEGVDDADMQGLWHMLPSTADNSPALPRSHLPTSAASASTYPPHSASNQPTAHLSLAGRSGDRKLPQVKALGLSKIPIVGGAGGRVAKPPLPPMHNRNPTSPGEKEFSDEGYWDTPSATPTATPDESRVQPGQKMTLSRDSCSGDHLYDLYNDGEDDDQELNSTPSPSSECKLSPTSQNTPPSSSSSSSFRSIKDSTSLPRDSKIPISSRPISPPHSTSPAVQETEPSPPKTQAAPPPVRTRIPVSRVPVRRSGSKSCNTAKGAANQK